MRARVVPAVVVLCLALTACSGDDDPPAATLPPTSTASPTPTVTAFAVPSEATAATPDGAAEFARFFYAQVALGFQTQDPSLVSSISQLACKTCSNYVRSIDTVRKEDLRVEGGQFEVFFATAPAIMGDKATVDVGWNFSPVTYYDKAGAVVEEGPPVKGVEEQLTLLRQSSSWVVTDIKRIRQRQ